MVKESVKKLQQRSRIPSDNHYLGNVALKQQRHLNSSAEQKSNQNTMQLH